MSVTNLEPRRSAEGEAQDVLEVASVTDLLRTAYVLTHRIGNISNGTYAGRETLRDLRAQRALIDAEIERRCAR